ncbi:MAG: DEAD/DEAH box helicase [archaeon]|nr:DEAD/DEAH box helicase [archaeon]
MSLELTTIHYEKRIHQQEIPKAELSEKESLNPSQTTYGNLEYDPMQKLFLFYLEDGSIDFSISPKEMISNKCEMTKENMIFQLKKDETIYDILISNKTFDTIYSKSYLKMFNILQKSLLKMQQENKLKKVNSGLIISKPKEYQIELLEEIKAGNSIIFLETGLGKTYLAILLIKQIFGEPIECNLSNTQNYEKKSEKKILCLFKTISLLLQQSEVIRNNTNLKVLNIYGDKDEFGQNDISKIQGKIKKADILCCTPELIYKYFCHGFVSSKDFALAVFDECHHCQKHDFYNLLLQHFLLFNQENNENKIQILGLTASPFIGRISPNLPPPKKKKKEEESQKTNDEKNSEEERKIQIENAKMKLIVDKISSLANNMESKICSPSNIINEIGISRIQTEMISLGENEVEESQVIKESEKVKKDIFHELLMPILDIYFRFVYDRLMIPYKTEIVDLDEENQEERKEEMKEEKKEEKKEEAKEEKKEEAKEEMKEEKKDEAKEEEKKDEKKKNEGKRKKDKKTLEKEISEKYKYLFTLISFNYYLTLMENDENHLNDKFSGHYNIKNDISLIEDYIQNYCYNHRDVFSRCQLFLFTKEKLKVFLEKIKEEFETQSEMNNPIFDFSASLRNIKEIISDGDLLTKLQKYVKNINLICRYLDNTAVSNYSEEVMKEVRTFLLMSDLFKELKEGMLKKKMSGEKIVDYSTFVESKFVELKKLTEREFYFQSPYLTNIMKLIMEKSEKREKIILFVEQRQLAKQIQKRLTQMLNDVTGCSLKSAYVLGITSTEDKSTLFTDKDLKENLKLFKEDNDCVLLIATDVVEEGLDVTNCQNIVCLSEIKTVKEYIQKTGRARKENSKLYLFSYNNKKDEVIEGLEDVKLTANMIKKIVEEKLIKLNPPKRNFKKDIDYYETSLGARLFPCYAKKIVDGFTSSLQCDGYNFTRCLKKVEKIGNEQFVPYLMFPAVLEFDNAKIYDGSNKSFKTEEEAKTYFNRNEDKYYFNALIFLHKNKVLSDYLTFKKEYDNLIYADSKYIKCHSENKMKIKPELTPLKIENDLVEYQAYIMKTEPNYYELDYEHPGNRKVCLLCNSKINLVNFDINIPTNLLLKLYFFNSNPNFMYDDEMEEETKRWFSKKSQIPNSVYSRLTISLDESIMIKVPKNKIDLLSFFYAYSLFVATDSELYFYYLVCMDKLDFAKRLYAGKIKDELKKSFENYKEKFLGVIHHLKRYGDAILNYENHFAKFSLLKKKGDSYEIDFDYIQKLYEGTIKDMEEYVFFTTNCLKTDKERDELISNADLRREQSELLSDKFLEAEDKEIYSYPSPGSICVNLINFTKVAVFSYNMQMHVTGKQSHPTYNNKEFNNQQYYLQQYGIMTNDRPEYRKAVTLDYNMKIQKYKINLKNLGIAGSRNYSKFQSIKKFHFYPIEILQVINNITLDQLYLFTLFPVILFKVQYSLIYYYNSYILMNRFKNTFDKFEKFDIKMLIQSMNAKTTLELNNYERNEFLGDAILKFLASVYVYVLNPKANKDILFSERKKLENNQFLAEKSCEAHFEDILFTNPLTIKKVNIPGFSVDDSYIFDISYNRSFAKNFFFSNRKILNINSQKEEAKIDSEIEKEMKLIASSFDTNELRKDKQSFIVDDSDNPIYEYKTEPFNVTRSEIEEVAKNKVEIIPATNFRFVYAKTMADIVESLIGLIYNTSKYNSFTETESFNNITGFLKELKVLDYTFDDLMKRILEVSKDGLINENCIFKDEQRRKFMGPLLENEFYTFKNAELLYQAMTHSTRLTEDYKKKNKHYVNKSYQRLSFLGEAIIGLFVALYVFNNNAYANEILLHKMKICGINHHILSMLSVQLLLHNFMQGADLDLKNDVEEYKNILMRIKRNAKTEKEKYSIPVDDALDESFVVILSELFQSYVGAIFVDSGNIETTFNILNGMMLMYLNYNATSETYSEHPKEIILSEFNKRRMFFKKIRENGGNRVFIRYGASKKVKNMKLYNYQLVVDKYVIYEDRIYYNRSSITKTQEKAKEVFLKICHEYDLRQSMKMNYSYLDLKGILDYLKLPYRVIE